MFHIQVRCEEQQKQIEFQKGRRSALTLAPCRTSSVVVALTLTSAPSTAITCQVTRYISANIHLMANEASKSEFSSEPDDNILIYLHVYLATYVLGYRPWNAICDSSLWRGALPGWWFVVPAGRATAIPAPPNHCASRDKVWRTRSLPF